MKLIGLTGLPRSGKDTFAHALHLHGYARRAFADPLKEAAAVLLNRPLAQMHGTDGFDREAPLPEWGFSTRWFLQVFGTECLRQQIREDFWIQRMRNSLHGLDKVVITDVRFQNEVDLVHEMGGTVVEIRRPGTVRSGHVSDKGVTSDLVFNNDRDIEHLNRSAWCLANGRHDVFHGDL